MLRRRSGHSRAMHTVAGSLLTATPRAATAACIAAPAVCACLNARNTMDQSSVSFISSSLIDRATVLAIVWARVARFRSCCARHVAQATPGSVSSCPGDAQHPERDSRLESRDLDGTHVTSGRSTACHSVASAASAATAEPWLTCCRLGPGQSGEARPMSGRGSAARVWGRATAC